MSTPGKTMRCSKCGKDTICHSPVQKFCRACSPWKRQLKPNVETTLLCSKCGKITDRTSASQHMCAECSRYIRSARIEREVAEKKTITYSEFVSRKGNIVFLVCPKCRHTHEAEWQKGWNPRSWRIENAAYGQSAHEKLFCPTCLRIKKRQETAENIMHMRRYKKKMSKFSKFLLGQKPRDDAFLNLRYVSEEEINRLWQNDGMRVLDWSSYNKMGMQFFGIDKWNVADNCNVKSQWKCVNVITSTGGLRFVHHPGYYRFKPTKPNDITFHEPCDGGIPRHHSNWYVQEFGREQNRRHHKSYEIRLEIREKQRLEKEKEKQISIRKNKVMSERQNKSALQFFRTLGMMDVVRQKIAL